MAAIATPGALCGASSKPEAAYVASRGQGVLMFTRISLAAMNLPPLVRINLGSRGQGQLRNTRIALAASNITTAPLQPVFYWK